MGQAYKHSFKVSHPAELSLTVYNVGFQKCPPGYGWGPGVRDHFLLHYIVSGRGFYRLGDRTFVLSPGDAFLAPPEEPIYYEADREEPWEYYWVGFSGPEAAHLLKESAFSRERPAGHIPKGEQLRRELLEIYKARGSDYVSAVRMGGYLQAALALLMESGPGGGRESQGGIAPRAALYLRQNYTRPLTVEELAREAGISRSYLYRAFQAEYHCSPSAYLTGLRMERAAELLRRGGLSVGAVAASVGYEDAFYFSRVFKREKGMSPSDYREGP